MGLDSCCDGFDRLETSGCKCQRKCNDHKPKDLVTVGKTPEELIEIIKTLRSALNDASGHLDYCGYGDGWERECAESSGLPQKIQQALDTTKEFE